MNYKVSVIVPVYNAASYLAHCIDTLMKQTLREIEYIFIEDCSTDGSYAVLTESLSKYPDRQADVRIVRHDVNKGVSFSRNEGTGMASGDYIIHCDSDDWVDLTMYEKLYSRAVGEEADICLCDFYLADGVSKDCIHPLIDVSKDKAGIVKDYLGCYWNTLWNKLVSRTVYERSCVKFPDGITFAEDFYVTTRLLFHACKVTSVDEPLYYYNQANSLSILHSRQNVFKLQAQELECYEKTVGWLNEMNIFQECRKPMMIRLLKADCCLVYYNFFDEFRNLHPESHRYILANPGQFLTVKERIMMLLCVLRLDFICKLENRRHGRH